MADKDARSNAGSESGEDNDNEVAEQLYEGVNPEDPAFVENDQDPNEQSPKTTRAAGGFCGCCTSMGKCRLFFLVLALILFALTAAYVTLKMMDVGKKSIPNQNSPTAGPPTNTTVPSSMPSGQPSILREDAIADKLKVITAGEVFNEVGTAQNLAYLWIVNNDTLKVAAEDDSLVQRFVLATMFYSTDGEGWGSDGNNDASVEWLSGEHECRWSGTTCKNITAGVSARRLQSEGNEFEGTDGPTGVPLVEMVTGLDLADHNLKGSIPDEIGLLKKLEELKINNNELGGSIPTQIGNMGELRILHLNNNDLENDIPESLGNLMKLEELKLSNNQKLSGTVPQGLCDLEMYNFEEQFEDDSLSSVKCDCCKKSTFPPSTSTPTVSPMAIASNNPTATENNVLTAAPSVANTQSKPSSVTQRYFVTGKEDGDKFGQAVASGGPRLAILANEYIQIHELNMGEGFTDQMFLLQHEVNLTSWVDPSSTMSPKHVLSFSGSGDRLAIGSTINREVAVLDYLGGEQYWTPLLQASTVDNNGLGDESDMFGDAVALSVDGNLLAIGASNHSDGMGRVYTYEYKDDGTGPSWSLFGPFMNGTVAGEKFGSSLSLSSSGEVIAVAGILGQPYVYAYSTIEQDWVQRGGGAVGDAFLNEEFQGECSISLSADGNYLALGVPSANGDDENGIRRGRASVFKYDNVSDVWSPYGQVSGTIDDEMTGFSVALSSDASVVVVGSPGRDFDPEMDSVGKGGDAAIYRITEDSNGVEWTLIAEIPMESEPGDSAGYSVAMGLEDEGVIVGAPELENDMRGYVRAYQLNSEGVDFYDNSNTPEASDYEGSVDEASEDDIARKRKKRRLSFTSAVEQ